MALGEFSALADLLGSEYGWVVLLVLFAYQLFLPDSDYLWDTRLQTYLKRPYHKTSDVEAKLVAAIQVIRVLAHEVSSKTESNIEPDEVDDYLVENGIDPFEKFLGDESNESTLQQADD